MSKRKYSKKTFHEAVAQIAQEMAQPRKTQTVRRDEVNEESGKEIAPQKKFRGLVVKDNVQK